MYRMYITGLDVFRKITRNKKTRKKKRNIKAKGTKISQTINGHIDHTDSDKDVQTREPLK